MAAGLGYPLLWDAGLPFAAEVALKGSGVAFLALAAALFAPRRDGRLLALVLACGAAGDVLLELAFMAGVIAFALGHAIAILLYLQNRRVTAQTVEYAVPALLLAFGAAMPFLLLSADEGALTFLPYSLLLSAMAAAAWLSRFPRALTGLGAMLFVVSDALIAIRMGGDAMAGISLAVWLFYYAAQALIFAGVRTPLPPRER
jgi:uncharacterized membrane protein YhhN